MCFGLTKVKANLWSYATFGLLWVRENLRVWCWEAKWSVSWWNVKWTHFIIHGQIFKAKSYRVLVFRIVQSFKSFVLFLSECRLNCFFTYQPWWVKVFRVFLKITTNWVNVKQVTEVISYLSREEKHFSRQDLSPWKGDKMCNTFMDFLSVLLSFIRLGSGHKLQKLLFSCEEGRGNPIKILAPKGVAFVAVCKLSFGDVADRGRKVFHT